VDFSQIVARILELEAEKARLDQKRALAVKRLEAMKVLYVWERARIDGTDSTILSRLPRSKYRRRNPVLAALEARARGELLAIDK
jgi:hypothetical protein